MIKLFKKLRRKFWNWQCKKYGCITVGKYYGMAQAHCRRCGKKTVWAAEGVSEHIEPWGEYTD